MQHNICTINMYILKQGPQGPKKLSSLKSREYAMKSSEMATL